MLKEVHEDLWFKEHRKAGNGSGIIVRIMGICLAYLNSQERIKQFLVGMIFSNSEFYKRNIYAYF